MADGSKLSIYSALVGGIAVAAIKFVAWAMSGSSAMLTEAIHSVIDTTNQLLLLFGMHRGAKPPDEKHPFGYGMEVYFWTFVVSLLIFSLGGAVSIYQGVLTIDFHDKLTGPELEEAADQLSDQLKAADPRITRLFLRPGRAKN